MELIPVSSSNLAAVGFDPIGSVLVIQFRDGAIYSYFGVPESVFLGLLRACSKGRFFATDIKGRYEYRQVALAD